MTSIPQHHKNVCVLCVREGCERVTVCDNLTFVKTRNNCDCEVFHDFFKFAFALVVFDDRD